MCGQLGLSKLYILYKGTSIFTELGILVENKYQTVETNLILTELVNNLPLKSAL